MNSTWSMPFAEFFWLKKLECRRLWRHWRRWPAESCRPKNRRARSVVEDCERLESRMVLSTASVALNSVALDLAVTTPSVPLASLTSNRSAAAGSPEAPSVVLSSDLHATEMSQALINVVSSEVGLLHVQHAISVIASVTAGFTTDRQAHAIETQVLKLFRSLRSSNFDDGLVRNDKAEGVTTFATQSALRVLRDLTSDKVQTPLRLADADDLPAVSVRTRNHNEVIASAVAVVPQSGLLTTVTNQVPARLIDVPGDDRPDRATIPPTVEPSLVIPVVQAIPSNPTLPGVLSGESVIPRSAPPDVLPATTPTANVTLQTDYALIDAEFSSNLPDDLDLAPSPFAPIVEPMLEPIAPVAKTLLEDVSDRPWWKAFNDPKVWLAALITIASAFAFWRVKTHHRLAHPST